MASTEKILTSPCRSQTCRQVLKRWNQNEGRDELTATGFFLTSGSESDSEDSSLDSCFFFVGTAFAFLSDFAIFYRVWYLRQRSSRKGTGCIQISPPEGSPSTTLRPSQVLLPSSPSSLSSRPWGLRFSCLTLPFCVWGRGRRRGESGGRREE